MDINYIIERLEEQEVPSGYERDLVIIGAELYIVAINDQNFYLGKNQPSISLLKADIKPYGSFFTKDHRARMLIEKNTVIATELLRRTGAKKGKSSGKATNYGYDHFPYPYIFVPPEPPGDLSMSGQVQVLVPLKEEISEGEIYCQYCGTKLTKEEQFTHSCKKKPK